MSRSGNVKQSSSSSGANYLYLPTRDSTRSKRGHIAEFGPAIFIGFAVIFFIIGFGFFLSGVATAYFACQFASRDGSTGASRSQIRLAANTAATQVANCAFGQLARLRAVGGGPFVNGVRVRFLQVTPATGVSSVFNELTPNVDLSQIYQIRVESNYQVTIPFLGVVRGFASSDNVIDQPEALAVN